MKRYFLIFTLLLVVLLPAEARRRPDTAGAVPSVRKKTASRVIKSSATPASISAPTAATATAEQPFLTVGGLFQADAMYLGNAPQLNGTGDANWRQGKPYVLLQFTPDFSFNLTYAIPQQQLDSLFFQENAGEHVVLVGGQYSPVWGLENSADTSALNLLELPLPYGPFTPTYGLGGEVGFIFDPVTLWVGEYSTRIGTQVPAPAPISATLNFEYSPVHTDTDVFAIILSGWQQTPGGGNTFNFSANPEIISNNFGAIVATPNITNAKNYWAGNGAIAWEKGPLGLQGEYEHILINRAQSLGNLGFDGYYVMATYFLTGESRLFNFEYSGYVDITPIRHSYGAWQLTTQFSYLNLNDLDIQGGQERNWSIGLNFFPAKHLKYQLVYIRSWATPNSNGLNQNSNFVDLRMQLVF